VEGKGLLLRTQDIGPLARRMLLALARRRKLEGESPEAPELRCALEETLTALHFHEGPAVPVLRRTLVTVLLAAQDRLEELEGGSSGE